MIEGHCMKCKKKVEMMSITETPTQKGTVMMKGKCAICGTTVCKIRGKTAEEK